MPLDPLACQHPRDDLYRHVMTMPNGMFPVVCTRCWGQSMSPDPTIPLWTTAMYWQHIEAIEGPERAATFRISAARMPRGWMPPITSPGL